MADRVLVLNGPNLNLLGSLSLNLHPLKSKDLRVAQCKSICRSPLPVAAISNSDRVYAGSVEFINRRLLERVRLFIEFV